MPKRGRSGIPNLYKKHCNSCRNRDPLKCDCPWYGKYKHVHVNLANWSGQYVDPRRRQHAVVVLNRLDARRWPGRLCVSHRLRLEHSQAVLIVTNAVRARRLHRSRCLRRARRRIGATDDQHDREHADSDTSHHPRLNATRQNTARNGAVIHDGRWRRVTFDARSLRCVGHTSPPLLQEVESFLAERQVTLVQHLGHHVRALMHLEVQKGRLAVFDLIERRQFARVCLDVGELPVVPDRPDEERLFVFGGAVYELQLRRILLLIRGD